MSTQTLPSPTTTRTLLTRPEAAEYLGVEVQTLAAWSCTRKGPAYIKVGRSVRYRLSDLEAFIQRGRVTTSEQQ